MTAMIETEAPELRDLVERMAAHQQEMTRLHGGRLDAQARSIEAMSGRLHMADEADRVFDARIADLVDEVRRLRARVAALEAQ